MKRLGVPAAVLLLMVTAAPGAAPAASAALPRIHHVYVIVLENESAATTFGAHSPAPYLSRTLRAQGAYVPATTASVTPAMTTTSR